MSSWDDWGDVRSAYDTNSIMQLTSFTDNRYLDEIFGIKRISTAFRVQMFDTFMGRPTFMTRVGRQYKYYEVGALRAGLCTQPGLRRSLKVVRQST